MSLLYTTEKNKFNSGPKPSIGYDVDQSVISVYTDDEGVEQKIMDYDILSRPSISGTNIITPAELDTGIPPIPEISENSNNS